MPCCRCELNTATFGISTTSALSRLNSENTASMPPPFCPYSRRNGVDAPMVPQTFFVSTSRSAPSASP